jgi:cellulase
MMSKNCGKKNFTVPKDLKGGNYLVRAEALALHTASGDKGAQFYMSCYQGE